MACHTFTSPQPSVHTLTTTERNATPSAVTPQPLPSRWPHSATCYLHAHPVWMLASLGCRAWPRRQRSDRAYGNRECDGLPVHALSSSQMQTQLPGPVLTASSQGAFCLAVAISTEMVGDRVWGIRASEGFSAEYLGGKVLYT